MPVNQPVKLILGSEDVIHAFYIPAFRVKMDAVPGRQTTMWFEATTPGSYHLFCAEYCGTSHSGMIGTVHVMEQPDFQAWLGGGRPTGTMAEAGPEAVHRTGLHHLPHRATSTARGPKLEGVFGNRPSHSPTARRSWWMRATSASRS